MSLALWTASTVSTSQTAAGTEDDETDGELLEGARVLVAASDACWRWSLCGWLALRGATTRQVAAGADALELVATGAHFDLAVIDLAGAALDSLWVVATLRALGVRLPCVVVDRGAWPPARLEPLAPKIALVAPLPFASLPPQLLRLARTASNR